MCTDLTGGAAGTINTCLFGHSHLLSSGCFFMSPPPFVLPSSVVWLWGRRNRVEGGLLMIFSCLGTDPFGDFSL